MADPLDPYKTLQVDPEAEDEVIQAAYRRLARKYHPDLAANPEAAARMAQINAAWELIGKPERRAAFDRRPGRTHGTGTGHGRSAGTHAGNAGNAADSASSRPSGGDPAPAEPPRPQPPPPETVSSDWTSGRSNTGGGYDESMRSPEGVGAVGPPPGRPWGSVLNFGRYSGWSLGEIARTEIEYIEWLDRAPIGRQYREEIDQLLRGAGRRQSAETQQTERRGLFRRR
jgi:curved DNA-binding protein CbpA